MISTLVILLKPETEMIAKNFTICSHFAFISLSESQRQQAWTLTSPENTFQHVRGSNHSPFDTARDTRPLWVKFPSFSCSFRENFGQIIGWRPHLGGWRTPFGKSWIRHWFVVLICKIPNLKGRRIFFCLGEDFLLNAWGFALLC